MVNLDYLYNPEAAKNYFSKTQFVDKKLSFQIIERGMILPYRKHKDRTWGSGGIIDSNGNFIDSSYLRHNYAADYIPPPTDAINYSSETVIYLGMFHGTWGHAITDNIRRLWFLKSEALKNEFRDCLLVYVPCTSLRHKNFKRLLDILGVDFDTLKPIERPTKFEKIILPDESYYFSNKEQMFYPAFCETIEHVKDFALKNRTPTSSKKIYYFYGLRQTGEERLAEYFRSKGYEVVSPEKLTLDEQLNLLINCESFASTLGSCSHNSLFLRDGTETIFIPRTSGIFTGCQRVLNQVNHIHANYVDSTISQFGGIRGPSCFIISKQLKNFFGDKFDGYEEEDFKNFLEYSKNCLDRDLSLCLNAKPYYAKILPSFLDQLKQHENLLSSYKLPQSWETFEKIPNGFTYQTHIAKKGWSLCSDENAISNDIEQKHDIQAIKINFSTHKVFYSVYYNDAEGWSEEVSNGEMSGTTGKSKPITGIKIRLDEAGTKEFDILYRLHKFDGEWTAWAKNGEVIYSHGQKLNAIQIKLEHKRT